MLMLANLGFMKVVSIRKSTITGLASAAALLLPAGSASAVDWLVSSLGSDYSINIGASELKACDNTSDGNDVTAEYFDSNTSYTDVRGVKSVPQTQGDGMCTSISLASGRVVYSHRAVQLVPWAPDNYGSWRQPR